MNFHFPFMQSRSSPERGEKVAHLKPSLPLEGSLRRRAYSRSTTWSRSERSDAERSRAWGTVRRAQRASGDSTVSGGAVVKVHVTEGAVEKSRVSIGTYVVVSAHACEGAEAEVGDTKGATMLLHAIQGALGGTNSTRGGTTAKDSATNG